MAKLILLETSTSLCSTALSVDGRLVSYRESSEPKAHASLTAVFVDEMLKESGMGIRDCDAVCVSSGPGSYTGLRVGVSTAKGLCYGAGIPLIAVGTLEVLVRQAIETGGTALSGESAAGRGAIEGTAGEGTTGGGTAGGGTTGEGTTGEGTAGEGTAGESAAGNTTTGYRAASAIAGANANIDANAGAGPLKYIIPMIDARRMEVYTAVFSADGKRLSDIRAEIIGNDSFSEQLAEGAVLFVGDAVDKCRTAITHPCARFLQCAPQASSMIIPTEEAYKEKRFEDVAYFEPFYLKDFVATVSRKKLF